MAAMVRMSRSDSEYLLWMLCMMYHIVRAGPAAAASAYPGAAPPSPRRQAPPGPPPRCGGKS